MKKLHSPLFQSLSDLLFPRSCLSCNQYLNFYESSICVSCQIELPQTHFHQTQNNPIFKKLKLLFPLQAATVSFTFQKEGVIAHLIHDFKYKGNLQSGVLLAHYLANSIEKSDLFKNIEGIIPVPLHPAREKKRGFNQAEIIGQVISDRLDIPIYTNIFCRIKKTKTLANLGDEERWKEIKDAFCLNSSCEGLPKHFLLIDDVITTGATLAACAHVFQNNSSIKLSIAALACRL